MSRFAQVASALAIVGATLMAAPRAEGGLIIDFEDLADGVTTHLWEIGSYQGFNWSNNFASTNDASAGSGYAVMGTHFALTYFEETPIWMTTDDLSLTSIGSVDMISAWRTSNTWLVEGLVGGANGAVIYATEVTMINTLVSHVDLNYVGVDTLKFTHLFDSGIDEGGGSGIHIALDNIVVPAPGSLALLALAGLMGRRRRRG